MASKEQRQAAIESASRLVDGGSPWLRRRTDKPATGDGLSVANQTQLPACAACGARFSTGQNAVVVLDEGPRDGVYHADCAPTRGEAA